jgi:imidazolonepropionase-like amidohydrolase
MKIELIAFSVAVVSAAAFLGAAPAFADDRPVALVGLRIIDGTGAPPIEDGALVYRGDRIVAVGQRKTVALPEGCVVKPLPGATALPGLINAHVHSAYNEKHAALWASCGITTVRDLSCDRWQVEESIAFRDRARPDPRLCRIVSAGSLITVPWGYMAKSGIAVRSEQDALAKVDREIDLGVDFVKIILQEPSFPRFASLSPKLAATIVDRAHGRGVPVTAHVGTSADLGTALDLGVDDIAHIASDELPQELIDRMVALHICLEPTLTNWAAASSAERSVVMDNFRRFVAAGGIVALGAEHIHTARNVGPFVGFPMAELQMMREGGMGPMQIIVAMTGNAARACRLQDQIGTLEPGKIADILVLDGDPLADLAAFTRVALVVHGGTVIRE